MHLALGVCRKVGLHLLFQGKAALCQMGNTFVRKLELLFQLGDLFLQSRSVLRSCVVHNRILLIILFHFSRGCTLCKKSVFCRKMTLRRFGAGAAPAGRFRRLLLPAGGEPELQVPAAHQQLADEQGGAQ